jgi:Ca2+-binding EF-hand superfamily protein
MSVEIDTQTIKNIFDLFDSDGGGSIDTEELARAFVNLGISDTREEVDKLVSQIDQDGSGEIEYAEFVEVMHSLFSSRDTAAEMSKAFSYMADGKERITIADLRKISIEVQDEQSEAYLQEMLLAGDLDKDGAVTFADFRIMMEQAVQNERSGLDDPRKVINQANQAEGARI